MKDTASIDRLLDLWPILVTVIPLMDDTSFLFKYHVIFNGVSPFVTIHCIPTVSPALAGSSPNVKGWIWGKTVPISYT